MALHENMKNAKIIEEVFGYLLENGYKKINVSIEIKEEETTFVATIHTKNEKIVTQLKNDIFCCRESELEEYGWELMGDETCVCELKTVGMLVDNYDIAYENEICTLTLHRKKLY